MFLLSIIVYGRIRINVDLKKEFIIKFMDIFRVLNQIDY